MDWQVLAALMICGAAFVAYLLMGDGAKSPPVRDTEDTTPLWQDTPTENLRVLQKADDAIVARFVEALRDQP